MSRAAWVAVRRSTAGQLGWVLFTGLLLAGYVGTWMTALSRARAIDVTSILVAERPDHGSAAGAGRDPAPGAGVARTGADIGGQRVGGLAHAAPCDGGMSDPDANPLHAGAAQRTPIGPLLFARYAYPPNELGYCGPSDPGALLESASDGLDLAELAHLATGFAGAWPYLELIAGCNGIADPLDARVVEAYWVGNPLLGKRAGTPHLLSSLSDRFEDRAGRRFGPVASAVPLGGVCQHSFHVFAVYPWLGLLRAGMEGAPLTVLDRCRIRWGCVEAVTGDLVTVRNRVLRFDGSRLVLGPEEVEMARRSLQGVGLAPRCGGGRHGVAALGLGVRPAHARSGWRTWCGARRPIWPPSTPFPRRARLPFAVRDPLGYRSGFIAADPTSK